jgi:intron-binding protein aquarius
MHPTTRQLDDDVDGTEMTGVEHLGQYVYEMTQAKASQLRGGTGKAYVLQEPAETTAYEEVSIQGEEDFSEESDTEEPGVEGDISQPEELDV